MITSLTIDERLTIADFKNELCFLQRQVQELERRQNEAHFQLTANKNQLCNMQQHCIYIESENRYFENQIDLLDVAIKETYLQLGELKKKIRN
jgi:hypothetical protein